MSKYKELFLRHYLIAAALLFGVSVSGLSLGIYYANNDKPASDRNGDNA